MTYIATIKIKPKGHLVLPAGLGEGFKEGEELVVTEDGSRLILRKASSMSDEEKEDLEVARRVEEAYKEIERGEYIAMDWDDFLEEAMRW